MKVHEDKSPYKSTPLNKKITSRKASLQSLIIQLKLVSDVKINIIEAWNISELLPHNGW